MLYCTVALRKLESEERNLRTICHSKLQNLKEKLQLKSVLDFYKSVI